MVELKLICQQVLAIFVKMEYELRLIVNSKYLMTCYDF